MAQADDDGAGPGVPAGAAVGDSDGAKSDGDGPPRALLIAALVLSVVAVGAVLAIAASRRAAAPPVAIAAVPAPRAQTPECRALMDTLPDRLGPYRRATTAEPTPEGTAAWRGSGGAAEPVILRCGLDRPAEFVEGSPIQMVDQVGWFRLEDADSQRSTWLCVDRPVYLALTLPADSGPSPIQTMSAVIERTMPAIPIRPGKP